MKQSSKIGSFFFFPTVVFLIHTVAKGAGLYEMCPNVDILSHYIGGFAIAYTATQILSYLESEKIIAVMNRMIFLLLILSLTSTAAVFWEFAEFISDQFLHTHLQPGVANTMQDQFLGITGGATWTAVQLQRFWRAAQFPGSNKKV